MDKGAALQRVAMGSGLDRVPQRAGQVLFSCGNTAVSVHVTQIDQESCRLPHAGTVAIGQRIILKFLDEVSVAGTVEAIDGAQMLVRFDRQVSRALVEYFAPAPVSLGTKEALYDNFGRSLPPLRQGS